MDDIGLHSHIGSATSAPAILSSSAAAASTTTTSTTASAYSVSDWYQEQEIHVEGELHDAFDHVAPSSPSDERPPPPPSAARSSSSRSSLGDISATGGGGGAAAATTSSETAKQHELAEAELDGRGAALNEAHAGGCCSLTMAVIVVFFAIYLVLLGLVGWSLLLPLTVVYAAAFLPASAWWTAMCFGRRAALRASVPPTMVFEIYVSAFVLAMPLVLLQWVVATVCFSSLELALDEFVAPEELRTMLLSPAQQQQQLLIVWLTVAIYTPLYAVLVRALPQVLLVLLLLRRLYTNREPLNTRHGAVALGVSATLGIATCSLAFDVDRVYWYGGEIDGAIALAIHLGISVLVSVMVGFWAGVYFARRYLRRDPRKRDAGASLVAPLALAMLYELPISVGLTLYFLDMLDLLILAAVVAGAALVALIAMLPTLVAAWRWFADSANFDHVDYAEPKDSVTAIIEISTGDDDGGIGGSGGSGLEVDDDDDVLEMRRKTNVSMLEDEPQQQEAADASDTFGFEDFRVDKLDGGGTAAVIGDLRQTLESPRRTDLPHRSFRATGHVDVHDTGGMDYMDYYDVPSSHRPRSTSSTSSSSSSNRR